MTRKALKVSMLLGLVALLVLAAGVVMADGHKATAELPEYVGSQACLGCHADMYTKWAPSGHHNMVTEIIRPSDLPGDINSAPEELKAELQKADYMVAGQRFLGNDPETGELVYLSVRWDAANNQYIPYKGGSSWEKGCAGCHSTGWSAEAQTWAEPGIGCEMCHGPGRDHILNKGDRSYITASTESAVCGQCHNGRGSMPDGTRWPVGYRPEMKTLEEVGFDFLKFDPEGPVPENHHYRQYAYWLASDHSKAVMSLEGRPYARDYCYQCHSAKYLLENEKGQAFDPKVHKVYDGVTCVACHDPHNSTEHAQLRMEPQALCTACHNGHITEEHPLQPGDEAHHPMKEMLEGWGAIGVDPTKGAHSSLKCIDCHMTEGNHMMKVIKPADVMGTDRKDTCTTCHSYSSAESRDIYLRLWQEGTMEKVEAAGAVIAEIEEALEANPNALSEAMMTKFLTAKTNLSFVEADASKGVHNFEYAIKILAKVQEDLNQVKAALK